jgi:hypothetical protein
MHLISGQDAPICDWLTRKFNVHVLQHPRVVLGMVDDAGVLNGAFVVVWKTDTTAELNVYGTVSHETVRAMFRTVFETLNVYRLEVRTPRDNKTVQKAAPKYGFRFDGIERDYYGQGQDAVTYALTPNNCRWLKDDHGLDVQSA